MTTVKVLVSHKFNSEDADVIFRSSDGVLFQIHRKNLEVCADAFPPAEIPTRGEVVELIETSGTLELLFQFMYPQRHPALDTTPFEVLYPLAEASEKYQVFPAMNICHIRLRDMVHDHPVEVAVYAATHDYPYLVSEVAPMMIAMKPVDVIKMLPPYLVLPWTQYVAEWTEVLQKVALAPSGHSGHIHGSGAACKGDDHWLVYSLACSKRLGAGIHTLRALDQVFDIAQDQENIKRYRNNYNYNSAMRDCCKDDLAAWRKRIEDVIAKIPKFSTFL